MSVRHAPWPSSPGEAWLLTAVVLQLLLGGSLQVAGQVDAAQSALLAWTLLAMLGVAATWQPPPRSRRTWLAVAVVTLVAVGLLARGGVDLAASSGTYRLVSERGSWLPRLLDGGPLDTLHTGALLSWVGLLVVGVAAWRIDRRLVVAAAWLAPFAVLSQVRAAGLAMIVAGLASTVAVVALGIRRTGPAVT